MCMCAGFWRLASGSVLTLHHLRNCLLAKQASYYFGGGGVWVLCRNILIFLFLPKAPTSKRFNPGEKAQGKQKGETKIYPPNTPSSLSSVSSQQPAEARESAARRRRLSASRPAC
ncbi:hypothetical protein VTH06DRAFT_7056 [Thermothelomyces fergusii]